MFIKITCKQLEEKGIVNHFITDNGVVEISWEPRFFSAIGQPLISPEVRKVLDQEVGAVMIEMIIEDTYDKISRAAFMRALSSSPGDEKK